MIVVCDIIQSECEELPRADAVKRRINNVGAEIDRIVYRLYDLNEEEIRIVEGKE